VRSTDKEQVEKLAERVVGVEENLRGGSDFMMMMRRRRMMSEAVMPVHPKGTTQVFVSTVSHCNQCSNGV
jgi:hypothetical protein